MPNQNMKLLFLALTTLAMSAANSIADEPNVTRLPIANATTVVIASIDPGKVTFPDWLAETEEDDFFGIAELLRRGIARLQTISPDDTVFAALDYPYASSHSATRLLVRNRDPNPASEFTNGSDYTVTTLGSVERFEYLLERSETRSRFEEAKQSVKTMPIKLLIAPPQYIYDTFDQLLPTLPESLGGGPTSVVTKGLQWAALGVDPSDLTVRAMICSNSNEDAKVLAANLPALLMGCTKLLPDPTRATLQPVADRFIKVMRAEVDGPYVRVTFPTLGDNRMTRKLLAEVAQQLTGSTTRTTKTNKFRAISLAILNYESANQVLPPKAESRAKDGRPGLSWRVHILPYLGKDNAALWNRFRLDEPWDSPHNIALLPEMPDIYNPRSRFPITPELQPGYTTYVAPVGEGTVFGQDKPTRFGEIRDGTSKTAILVEVKPDKAVPWTAPQDYEFNETNPARDIAWDRDDVTLGAFCDGHVEKLKREIPAETWLHLFQKDDGHPIQLP